MRPGRALHHHAHSFPWLIWVETIRNRALMVSVYSPKFSRVRRRLLAKVEYAAGPIYFSSDKEQAERITELIEAGTQVVPPDVQYRVALSLEDAQEILAESWGVPPPPA